MPTIVGILTLMSRINFILILFDHEIFKALWPAAEHEI